MVLNGIAITSDEPQPGETLQYDSTVNQWVFESATKPATSTTLGEISWNFRKSQFYCNKTIIKCTTPNYSV